MENWGLPSDVKKCFFTFFLFFFLLLTFASNTTATTGMMGDVNGDGVIDVRDSVMVMRNVLGLQTLSTSQKLLADVNGDGLINVADVNLITQRTLGLINRFPVSDLYSVSFNGNGGLPAQQSRVVRHGDTIQSTFGSTMPTDPTRSGHNFSGWNTRVDGLGTWFNFYTPVYSSLNLYAQWQPIVQEHTISFNANGGTPGIQTRTVMNGSSLGNMPGAMPTPPTRTGYIFTGWNTHVNGMGSWFTSSTTVNASSTVYAQWQPITTTHTVTFSGNGGSPAVQTRTMSHGSSLGIMPSNPILLGVQFIGWNTMPDGSGTTFTAFTPVYGDLTVYAQWQPLTTPHTVTFNSNGGSPAVQTRTVSHGGSLGTMPSNPILLGVQFIGWNTMPDGSGTPFTAWTPVYGDLTVYAQWQILSLSHTVTFNGNGGTPTIQTRAVSHGESLGLAPGAMPSIPSRTGSTFIEWNTHWTGYGSSFTPWTAVVEDITVYAIWSF